MKKISIIVPIYNVAPYLKRCLDSITNQTFKNIECILVDDCGSDNSIDIAEEYVQEYEGEVMFKIIHHQKNQGQGTARNTGLKSATGDYIFFFDSDDAITPDCLDTLYYLANKYPNADFIQGNTVADVNLNLMPYSFNIIAPEFCDNKEELERLILSKLSMTVWNRLIKRSFIIEHNLYFPNGILCEDMYWIYFLGKEVSAAAFTNKGTYLYYKNENSDVNSKTWLSRFRHYQGQMTAVNDFYKDILHSKHVSIYQRQYLASNLAATMVNLSAIHTFQYWMDFWKLVCKMSWSFKHKVNLYRFLLLLTMMPPLCFLASFNGWMWRLKHYLVSKV